MKKYFKLFVALLVLLVFVGTFVFLYKKSLPQPDVYEEFTPKMGDISKTTIVTGKIEPRNEVSVKPQISGIITEKTKIILPIPANKKRSVNIVCIYVLYIIHTMRNNINLNI